MRAVPAPAPGDDAAAAHILGPWGTFHRADRRDRGRPARDEVHRVVD